jgi:NAD(P)-dependent dehydrogenase (short-subunit alcohol dehydrogenase family)
MQTNDRKFGLHGKVVVLTGGAGIYGRGLASDLAAAGATLVLASRNLVELERVAKEECAKGGAVTAEAFDQGDENSIISLRDRLLAKHGRIHGLVNNAVARPMRGHADALAQWRQSMDVNGTGLFALTRAFGDEMAKCGQGSIVNVGSIFGMVGPNLANYEGTEYAAVPDYFFHKGGMVSLTRYFASVYGGSGIRVNCVSPGGFFTGQHPLFVERYRRGTMLNRMASADDLGGPVIFLLSDAAAYVTAVNLPVDGGYTGK